MSPTFEQIKANYSKARPYEDPEFDAVDTSLFTSRRVPREFVWKRPHELVSNPMFVDEGASRMDVVQGQLGNCWFLAGIASLAQIPKLFHRVMPLDQGFDAKNYCGAFHFNFWQGGKWVEVIIDDRLPTYYNRLAFVHSESRDEFWSALLEKAYAKLWGSYEALVGGQAREALEDFTGGVVESYELGSKAPSDLFNIMMKVYSRTSLLCCSIDPDQSVVDQKLENGLVTGHAYTVTDVRKVNVRTASGRAEVELVRIRNPWASDHEWKGAWGDKSAEWTLLTEQEKQELGLIFAHDGEFWMSYRDLVTNLHHLDICVLSPGDSDGSKAEWHVSEHQSSWKSGTTAGGCRNYPDTFHKNPQFRVTLTDVDDQDNENMCSLIVNLMQLGQDRKDRLSIGFAIYNPKEEDLRVSRLGRNYFLYNASTARSDTFINARSITKRFRLKPGIYCIVPSTFYPNKDGDFLLRLYTEKSHSSDVNDENTRVTRPVRPRVTTREDKEMDSKYKNIFDSIAGMDEKVNAMELKRLLQGQSSFREGLSDSDFNLETCRSLVALYDDNATGKIEFDAFKKILALTLSCHKEFKTYDTDKSGDVNMFELQDLLTDLGVTLSSRSLTAITHRYSNRNQRVDFDDVLQIYARLVNLIETFEKKAAGKDKILFTVDEFIEGAAAI